MATKVMKTDEEWKRKLTPDQYKVMRRKGTEQPWSGGYNDTKEEGVYRCAGCETELFRSEAKFDSASGWPSFFQAIDPANVHTKADRSLFMRRTEVLCASCDAHLGHVFPDGPRPTGQRYCINSIALKLDRTKKA